MTRDMSSCSNCKIGEKVFVFYDDERRYSPARRNCLDKTPKQNIVRNIDADDYSRLFECCPNGRNYWIGLEYNSRICPKQFRWRGEQNCFDQNAFISQPDDKNTSCLAVAVEMRQPNSSNNIPAILQRCNAVSGYICQRYDRENIFNYSSNTAMSTNVTAGRAASTIATIPLPNTNSHSYLVAVILGVVVLILTALLVLIYLHKKKHYFSWLSNCTSFELTTTLKRPNSTVTNTTSNDRTNPFYYTVEQCTTPNENVQVSVHNESYEQPKINEVIYNNISASMPSVYNHTTTTTTTEAEQYNKLNFNDNICKNIEDHPKNVGQAFENIIYNNDGDEEVTPCLEAPPVYAVVQKKSKPKVECVYAVVDKTRTKSK